MALFAVKDGLRLYNDLHETVDVLNGSLDPSAGSGLAADVGSMYLRSDGSSYKKVGAADTDWQLDSADSISWTTISGATDAEARGGYVLDSSAAAFTVTMPATPELGDIVSFTGLGDIETNNVTVAFNGNNLHGSSDDLVIDLNYCYFDMMYSGDAATGWVLSNTDESGDIYNNTVNIATNSGNIVINASGIAANAAAIDAIELDIIDHSAAIAANASGIAVNVADIATNASDIADNYLSIVANAADIATNAFNIATNSGNIATNTADIATNASGIAVNAADIFTNAGNIATNAGNISTNATDITALETYTGSAGDTFPDYANENYITDSDSLVTSISKLDAALDVVANLAATGVNWRQSIKAATSDTVDTGVATYSGTDHFVDDDTPFWTHDDWNNGDQILSTVSGIIYTWNDSADQWEETGSLGANDAVAVIYDFLDNPGSQEDGAAYMMNSTETAVIKIADFDLETAASIAISSGYTATDGTITSGDSVETAIEKLDYRSGSSASDITALDGRVTTNEGDIITNASGIAANAASIASNAIDIFTNADNIATNASGISVNVSDIDSLEAAVGSSTGLAGMGYTSTSYVTAESSVVDAISALDVAIGATDTTVSGLSDAIVNVDTAHDNLAAAVLTETSTLVVDSATDVVLDTVSQAGNLGAKWFIVAYDGTGKRYACEIYAMHDGSTTADLTEYAILTIGTPRLEVTFDVVADGTDMTLIADNTSGYDITVKAQRTTIQTVAIDTTAVL